jgi:hypothetical protein
MTPSLEATSPLKADAESGQEIAVSSPKKGILMHTDTHHATTGWLQDAWRLWARPTEHPEAPR